MTITDSEAERLKDITDVDLYEDYALVLSQLSDEGVKSVRCDMWCGECEEESEAEVNTTTFVWVCPVCGNESDQ